MEAHFADSETDYDYAQYLSKLQNQEFCILQLIFLLINWNINLNPYQNGLYQSH